MNFLLYLLVFAAGCICGVMLNRRFMDRFLMLSSQFRTLGMSFFRRLSAWVSMGSFLLLTASVLFVLGITLPCFTIKLSTGDLVVDAIINTYGKPGIMNPATHSVISGVSRLLDDGDSIVGLVIICFSILFPTIKLTLAWIVLVRPSRDNMYFFRFLEVIGPWSMADVFVVAILLLLFKAFPGKTTFVVNIGWYLFLLSVVLGMLAAYLIKRKIDPQHTSVKPT